MSVRMRSAIVVSAALLVLLLGAVPASAVPVLGTGTIDGTIRSTGGAPLSGSAVLYGIQGNGSLHATGLSGSTDASGHFAITAPNSERYKVLYSLGGAYASAFWAPGGVAPTGAMGETVTVSVGGTVTCDATLPVGFAVSGKVTKHANGAGVGEFEVYPWVFDESVQEWREMWGWQTASSDETGTFSFYLLGGHKYRLQWGNAYTPYPWYMGYWNGASLFSRAATMTAIAGGSRTGVNASLRVKVASETIAGSDRIQTSIAASRRIYPDGGGGDGDAVVIATGYDWPDALAGAALAYAADGPLLLTKRAPASMPASLVAEVQRLKAMGASRAYILGGESTVGTAVAAQLAAEFGSNVFRLGGANRYETSAMVASETIVRRGPGNFDGTVMIATGKNYADAMAASPVSAKMGWPIVLAQSDGNGGLSDAMTAFVQSKATKAIILGSTGAVSSGVATDLATALGGWGHVERWYGDTRVDTAISVAEHAVAYPGSTIGWNGLAFSYGWNYPDALSCGPLVASGAPSVILLTPNTNKLTPTLKAKLQALAAGATIDDGAVVDEARFLGGSPNPLGLPTRAALIDALE